MFTTYVLVDKIPVAVGDLYEWCLKNKVNIKEEKYWRVEYTQITESLCVSTVFLGVNANEPYIDEPPIFFETAIMDDKSFTEFGRYSTWEEAEQGHWQAVGRAVAAWRNDIDLTDI